MICPQCGNDDTSVTKTYKPGEEDGEHLMRRRKCAGCGHSFKTFECYEPADVEASFDNAEALQLLDKSRDWLVPPARHIPLVRDSLKLLDSAAKILRGQTISRTLDA